MDIKKMMQDQPIPGENYTSDTKSYPWHQPPEHVKLSAALDMLSKKMTKKNTLMNLITFMEAGFPLVNITQMILMQGVAEGKWTLDLALLLAGPVTKILEIIAGQYDIEVNIGINEQDNSISGYFFKDQTEMKRTASPNAAIRVLDQELPNIKEEAAAQETPEAPEEGGAPETPEQDLGAAGGAVMKAGTPPGGFAPKPEDQGVL